MNEDQAKQMLLLLELISEKLTEVIQWQKYIQGDTARIPGED